MVIAVLPSLTMSLLSPGGAARERPHVVLAALVACIWGVAFVATRIALDAFSPALLAALRFVMAAAPVLVFARPPIPWSALVLGGLSLFAGQFLFQFFGIALGMPPGLAALVVQTQALYTILFAALALRERPSPRQLAGTALAFGGLVLITATVGADLTLTGLALTMLSAISWGVGNVLLKRLPPVDTVSLMVWLSLIPPLPALAVALILDGPAALVASLARAPWSGMVAALYLGLVATVLAYAIWGMLLRRYAAAAVAPFALLVPCVAAAGSSLVFGERFGPLRLVVLTGLAVIVLPIALPVPRPRRVPLSRDKRAERP
jgi:O-acetylserine/cysteine efflux transporter